MASFTFLKFFNLAMKLVVAIVLILSLSTCSGFVNSLKNAFPVRGTENQKKIIAEEFWARFFNETVTQVAIRDVPIESVPLDSISTSGNLDTELYSDHQEQISTDNLQTNDLQTTQLALACPENSTDFSCVSDSQDQTTVQPDTDNQTQLAEPQTTNNNPVYSEGEISLNFGDSTVEPLIIAEDSNNFEIIAPETTTSTETDAIASNATAVPKPAGIPEAKSSNQTQTAESEPEQPANVEPIDSTVDQNSPEKIEINQTKTTEAPVQTDTAKLELNETQSESSQSQEEEVKKLRWPVTGRIIAEFGTIIDGEKNEGINLAVPEGTPVKAAEDGLVLYSDSELEELGNLILIRHSGDWVSVYAHIKESKVDRGDTVKRGDEIAYAGASGPVDYPQLHFELRTPKNVPVNPLDYLPKQ